MKKLKRFLLFLLDLFIPHIWNKRFSYSQEGEDLMFLSFFEDKKDFKGTYIDIGAHHPYRFSNTALLYAMGWNGVNVEPSKEGYKKLCKHRKKDVNICAGIGPRDDESLFYIFSDPALNTFCYDKVRKYIEEHNVKFLRAVFTNIFSLDTLLVGRPAPTLLNIDCEGMDEEIILSTKFSFGAPKFIMIEDFKLEINDLDPGENKIFYHLQGFGYELVGKTKRTSLYKLSE